MRNSKIPKCNIYAQTDIGKHRKNNEDAAYCGKSEYGVMLAVADGMGGYRKGEVASQLVIDYASYAFEKVTRPLKVSRSRKLVIPFMDAVNKRIFTLAQTPDFQRMATTTTIAVIGEDGVYIFASGDSRLYVYKKEYSLKQITFDQNYYQYLCLKGKKEDAELLSEEKKHTLYTGIGVISFLDDYEERLLKHDDYDTILLCSDGLYNMVSDAEIENVLKDTSLTLQEKGNKLVEKALDFGGVDNIAVVLMEKVDGE